MLKSLARAIVRRYPAAWRERYEDEVLALVDAGAVRPRDVVDLLRGWIRERVLALYEPSRHIPAFRLISGLALAAFVTVMVVGTLAVAAVPVLCGYLIRLATGPLPVGTLDAMEWALLPFFILPLGISWIQLYRLQWAHVKTGAPLPPTFARHRLVVLGVCGGMSVLGGMRPDISFESSYVFVLYPWMVLTHFYEPPADAKWPGNDLFETLGRLRSVRYDLRWARMELDRCEGIYEGREPGPELRAARAEIARLMGAEADALASLDAMGYHARFARPS
jgi:hypothetical protein